MCDQRAGTISLADLENDEFRRVLHNAASLLTGQSVTDDAAQALLLQLDYRGDQPEVARHRSALLRTASRFRRIFAVRAPDAPNLAVLGAEVDPAEFGLGDGPVGHVAGTGLNFRQAFESCVGEGVEYASQFATADDPIALVAEDEALAGASTAWRELWERLAPYRRRDRRHPTAWINAASLADGEPVPVPADLCFRRAVDVRDLDPPWPLSTGMGAGIIHSTPPCTGCSSSWSVMPWRSGGGWPSRAHRLRRIGHCNNRALTRRINTSSQLAAGHHQRRRRAGCRRCVVQ